MSQPSQLDHQLTLLRNQHQSFVERGLTLDLTRGKPSAEQLDLSAPLLAATTIDNLTNGDPRNYGTLAGLPEAKALFGSVLGIDAEQSQQRVLVGGNSSLSLMHYCLTFANFIGLGAQRDRSTESWQAESINSGKATKILCPSPGYDRHFALCEHCGIDMIPVALTGNGPDMDLVEELVKKDTSIKGIWCVPRFSNPTGEVYSEQTVERLAALPNLAGNNFYVLWDNAYAVHSLQSDAPELVNIDQFARAVGTIESIIQFGSTSKITFAGAGIGYMAMGEQTLASFLKQYGYATIGSDKINQLRHFSFLENKETIDLHMKKHADIIRPKFNLVIKKLEQQLINNPAFGDAEIGRWASPQGGYFISFDTLPGLATQVVALAAEAGVKLTPAGATFPYGRDPNDSNIRLAPTYPSLSELDQAMDVFVNCVKLASAEQLLSQ